MPYTALTMLLTPSPRERDSATAYRECGHREGWGRALTWTPASSVTRSARSALGMTMEMAGTLMGAAVHGLIVSGAHGPHRCADAALPGPVAVSPDAVSAHAARPRYHPLCGVASVLWGRFLLRSLGGRLGAQRCTPRLSFLPFCCS